ncbi:MAG TPA: histidine phosphatase family protein [Candidatus Dormibacteraeota bacterium]
MSRTVDLRRHTDADGDTLTPDGVRMAVEIGKRLQETYDVVVSSGAQRATQTAACLLAGMARPVPGGLVVNSGFRSSVEERWFAAARQAKGKDLEAFRAVDPDLVEKESTLLGGVLRETLESLPEGGRALVVGHSPTTEAAVLGLTGQVVEPIAKGEGVRVVEDAGTYRIEPLD